jgi:tetratricopeptide (TPR) repeat protein
MRSCQWLGSWLLFGVVLWARQGCAQAAPAPSAGRSQNPSQDAGQSGAPASKAPSPNDSSVPQAHVPNLSPPRSDRVQADDLGTALGDSSSKDTQTDLSPPEDDAKVHPKSSSAVAEAVAGVTPGGISEFHTWDPHRAAKDIEVGNYYFKRGNYRAAEDRYREALQFKENDAVATFRLAVSLEKLGVLDDARSEYESYMKILPHGPEVEQAQKALDRLKARDAGTNPR